MDARTVLVVDDHPGFRACVRNLLERAGYRVVGEAGDGASAVASARELGPQLAVVDVCLPDIDGFEVAGRLARLERPPAVVLVSNRDRAELEPLAERSTACGFVPKDELSGDALEELL